MFGNDEFMKFMEYRYVLIETKIDECVADIKNGATEIQFEKDELTDSEIQHIISEVRRRTNLI